MTSNTTPLRITRRSRGSAALAQALACSAVASLGCLGDALEERDLGNTAPLLTSPGASDRSPVVLAEGAIDNFIAGHWIGQAENLFAPSAPGGERPLYAFPSGSVDITLDLSLDDPTIATGEITFGAGEVPEPLAGVPYPPQFATGFSTVAADLPLAPLEGFTYTLSESVWRTSGDVGVAAGTLSLGYAPNAGYMDWCALQTPHPRGDGTFDCLSFNEVDERNGTCWEGPPDGPGRSYDCELGRLCGARNVCRCTESQCSAADGQSHDLWLIRDGDDLLGTFVGAVFDHGSPARLMPIGSVRFRRVSP